MTKQYFRVTDEGLNYTTHRVAFDRLKYTHGVVDSDWAYSASLPHGTRVEMYDVDFFTGEAQGKPQEISAVVYKGKIYLIGTSGLEYIPSIDDKVRNPKHYQFYNTETIVLIRNSMNDQEWLGYCKGNSLKYRLRAGKKDNSQQEIDKAMFYEELYETYKDGTTN